MNRIGRSLATLALCLGVGLALPPAPAHAQEPPAEPGAEGGESKGDPLYGYVGTAFLCSFALFVVCKSARR
jgi:hypothetical protein